MKCDSCKNNWGKRQQIGIEELSRALETCNACKRHEFKLYSPVAEGTEQRVRADSPMSLDVAGDE